MWISYSKADDLLRQHVWVKELATGQEHQIGGGDFLTSTGAKWTPDGKKLLFLGGVGVASMASHRRAPLRSYTACRSFRWIRTRTRRYRYRSAGGSGRRAPAPAAAVAAERAQEPPPNVQVKIVWDGLDRRVTQLTRMPGSVSQRRSRAR